ncbi:unnamed protein product [Didymodactylos carnosus]|uniref:Sacsin/Nov domain-containing protein n=1 Tax=Didymodactylos carnosus TaxID=1234261 RepID=A0A815UVG2_9BILA|nr:unnamed protein product [Didymodactylos carnosus]CAF4380448.1 unnamed protein product [Didymodactylos carnosus]
MQQICTEGYTDRLAIFKEFIQNADDARANVVKFLYDNRSNLQWTTHLLEPSLVQFQSRALWVYNDAVFTENDFQNLIRLGEGTKVNDLDKIGKFGLGFNSVYNVTDLPSLISQQTLIMLDPHCKYLGKYGNGGIRLDFTPSQRTMLRSYKDQFEPYSGIFDYSVCELVDESFNGTLFRLPLRTSEQAKESLLSNTVYEHHDMLELLNMLVKRGSQLLLNTQNVCKIELYELTSQKEKPKLMCTFLKEPVRYLQQYDLTK